jgi:hypothetical protein
MTETQQPVLDPETERKVAVFLFNRVWDLLDAGDARSADETDEMINAAHASRWHWGQLGGTQRILVGEWQVSRAYAAAGLGADAVRHADRALTMMQTSSDFPAWLVASVHEGRARALLAAGDRAAAVDAYATAQEALAKETDDEERELIGSQMAELGL